MLLFWECDFILFFYLRERDVHGSKLFEYSLMVLFFFFFLFNDACSLFLGQHINRFFFPYRLI